MKNILILAVFFALIPSTHAALDVSVSKVKPSFEIGIPYVEKIKGTDKTSFTFEPEVINSQNIGSWRVLITCKGQTISIKVNSLSQNSCGGTVDLTSLEGNKFMLNLSNPKGNTAIFSFRLKAYDVGGNWIQTERMSFRWK